jgi:hypothetical protein
MTLDAPDVTLTESGDSWIGGVLDVPPPPLPPPDASAGVAAIRKAATTTAEPVSARSSAREGQKLTDFIAGSSSLESLAAGSAGLTTFTRNPRCQQWDFGLKTIPDSGVTMGATEEQTAGIRLTSGHHRDVRVCDLLNSTIVGASMAGASERVTPESAWSG